MVATRSGDRGEHVHVHLRTGPWQRKGVRAEGADPVTQPRRQHPLQLRQRPHRGLLDACDRAARGGTQADRDRHRLVVVEQQRRQAAAGAQPVAAGHTRSRLDRVAERAQPVHVVADGASGHVQPGGQLGTGPVAAGLQQGQQAEQPCRRVQHSWILSAI
jgi:hypothetical protein